MTVTDLPREHYLALAKAISNILCTSLAFNTFAQIVDGQPTRDLYQEYYGSFRADFQENSEPSDHAREIVRELQANFTIDGFQTNRTPLQLYEASPIGSRGFSLRLIELVAIICHDVAVRLYTEFDGGIRKPDPAGWRRTPPPPYLKRVLMNAPPPPPAVFFHRSYMEWEQYPSGVADIVGYWAEYRLFGGVVLFDRGDSGTDCRSVFLHPVGGYRIFQLSESQLQLLQDFLFQGGNVKASAMDELRFKAERKALRVDAYDAMNLNIYRNKYERRIPAHRPVQCVVLGDDDPEYADTFADFVKRTGGS